jgi:hypothetical protein
MPAMAETRRQFGCFALDRSSADKREAMSLAGDRLAARWQIE